MFYVVRYSTKDFWRVQRESYYDITLVMDYAAYAIAARTIPWATCMIVVYARDFVLFEGVFTSGAYVFLLCKTRFKLFNSYVVLSF